jgi:hypothetical protein
MLPGDFAYVYVRIQEHFRTERDPEWDAITISVFRPNNVYASALRRIPKSDVVQIQKTLNEMGKPLDAPYASQDLALNERVNQQRLKYILGFGTQQLPPWPKSVVDTQLRHIASFFRKDRNEIDVAIENNARVARIESNRIQAQLEGDSFARAMDGAVSEVMQQQRDFDNQMNQNTQQLMGNINTMMYGGGGGYGESTPSAELTREQREEINRKAAEESRKQQFKEKNAENKRCTQIGGKWVGGKTEYLLGGYCDETEVKQVVVKEREPTWFEKRLACEKQGEQFAYVYSRQEEKDVCVELGPVQNEATALCWNIDAPAGTALKYFVGTKYRYKCDGPTQKLHIAVEDITTALRQSGCEPELIRQRASIKDFSGESWFHCGFGLESYHRDVWMNNKGTNARPYSVEYRCRANSTKRCTVINDYQRNGLID